MNKEYMLFQTEIEKVGKRHDIPTATVNQIAQSLLRDGLSHDDMWDELDAWCRIWAGKVK